MKSLSDSNTLLKHFIHSERPFLVSRLGVVESNVVSRTIRFSEKERFPIQLRKEAWVNAGIFPPTKKTLRTFSNLYMMALENSDMLAIWPNGIQTSHDLIVNSLDKEIPQVPLSVLDILQCSLEIKPEEIWTRSLSGKNVLIVHPFASSFEVQAPKLNKIHSEGLIPEFTSTFVRPPQTNGLTVSKIKYAQQLELFKKELVTIVQEKDIKFALVAAGSYGLPISSFLKDLGLGTIYVGGTLQLYFGVAGMRWRNRADFKSSFNEYWLEHPVENAPSGAKFIEGKTYW